MDLVQIHSGPPARHGEENDRIIEEWGHMAQKWENGPHYFVPFLPHFLAIFPRSPGEGEAKFHFSFIFFPISGRRPKMNL